MPLAFNADQLPQMASEYVAWVDVMGTQVAMSKSIKITANFIFKLHIAALRATKKGITLYPVMDGFYAASASRNQMLAFLRDVYASVAEEFNSTGEHFHRFVIRGGLAFGPVIHGTGVGQCAQELKTNTAYSNSVLLGLPMVQAHLSEREAPPFGVFVHESARTFAPSGSEPLHWIWWVWKDVQSATIWEALRTQLVAYLTWSEERSHAIGYSADRVKVHKEMVKQYFEN